MGSRARAAGALPNLIRTLRKEAHNPTVTPVSQTRLLSLRSYQSHRQLAHNGFTVNGVDYKGSLLCVGNMLMAWAPTKFSDVTPHSLSIFQLVQPITETLILDCGRNIEPVDAELIRNIFLRSSRIVGARFSHSDYIRESISTSN
ncbi:NADH dehydrogenase [ubiquinone] 1 alpha subcomplex assembly factor 3-like [Pyrus ussuriensis x Pyrus communis]|uniref:NADH dehydrogenase [ubiquinone] 1 alpha subcomplex assembly factor 3-like n=1 Tax=Pyrus ussuriensis x Pyrus communis TaxID=2448454 RepID=A0A5N5G8G5_9ROSA|nr:NADH dehydrogenase [ubiquinone] 1 alpha subcomplex assembly factor 3-like [Pyrus ussuriensis x Pyrus communis]